LQRRARVASRQGLDAVSACAQCEARRGRGARERRCVLCEVWAPKLAHVGVVGAARTVTLGGFCFRELIQRFETGLVAR
jgi:hypothetical protein